MNEIQFHDLLQDEIRVLSRTSQYLHTKTQNASPGKLHIQMRGHTYPAFYRYLPGGRKYYLPKSDMGAIKELAQNDYHIRVSRLIDARLSAASALLTTYDTSISDFYSQLPLLRQQLVSPLIPTDEAFLQNWYATNPGSQNPYPIKNGIITVRGEIVRSKSEKILADFFYSKGIPYIYEPMLKWPGLPPIFPDFLLLNIRLRRSYYYEHFGKMDDEDYRHSGFDRITDYHSHGYWEGENLLYDFEGKDYQLNIAKIEDMIEHYLL